MADGQWHFLNVITISTPMAGTTQPKLGNSKRIWTLGSETWTNIFIPTGWGFQSRFEVTGSTFWENPLVEGTSE